MEITRVEPLEKGFNRVLRKYGMRHTHPCTHAPMHARTLRLQLHKQVRVEAALLNTDPRAKVLWKFSPSNVTSQVDRMHFAFETSYGSSPLPEQSEGFSSPCVSVAESLVITIITRCWFNLPLINWKAMNHTYLSWQPS